MILNTKYWSLKFNIYTVESSAILITLRTINIQHLANPIRNGESNAKNGSSSVDEHATKLIL